MSRSPAAELVQDVIRVAVQPQMKRLGFRKSGATFRHDLADCTQVLNVQSSSGNTWAEARFTINVGVFFPAAQALGEGLIGSEPGPSGPFEYQCTIRKRIGALLPGGQDLWWTVRSGAPIDEVVRAVESAVRDAAIPWLNRVSSIEQARVEASRSAAMVLAVLVNDLDTARAIAAEFATNRPDATFLISWARRHGLLA
ncbi:MAG TPA: DUF4304 domain-containing protein [Anaeromyxobacter sp.]|nr:DUF4304 domain-containing protein [Anaeromyxobacter sp.]